VVAEAVAVCVALAELRDALPVALTEVEDGAHRACGLRGGVGDTVEEEGQPPLPVAVIADGSQTAVVLVDMAAQGPREVEQWVAQRVPLGE